MNNERERRMDDALIDKVVEEAKTEYIEEYGKEAWNDLSNDERFDIGINCLQKHYNPELRRFMLNRYNLNKK